MGQFSEARLHQAEADRKSPGARRCHPPAVSWLPQTSPWEKRLESKREQAGLGICLGPEVGWGWGAIAQIRGKGPGGVDRWTGWVPRYLGISDDVREGTAHTTGLTSFCRDSMLPRMSSLICLAVPVLASSSDVLLPLQISFLVSPNHHRELQPQAPQQQNSISIPSPSFPFRPQYEPSYVPWSLSKSASICH